MSKNKLKNLYRETMSTLNDHQHVPEEILWVGNEKYKMSWEKFAEFAKDYEYNAGFGGTEVPNDLLIVGRNFWLERHEYDGSEWWEYKEQPKEPVTEFNLSTRDKVYFGEVESLTTLIEGERECGVQKL